MFGRRQWCAWASVANIVFEPGARMVRVGLSGPDASPGILRQGYLDIAPTFFPGDGPALAARLNELRLAAVGSASADR